MDFIIENIWSIVIGALVLAAVVLAAVKIIKDRKKGKCSCGCEGCAFSESCHKPQKDNNKNG